MGIKEKIQKQLFELQDTGYKSFHCKLMPTVATEKVIGIRVPVLRKFAKEFVISKESKQTAKDFLTLLPHYYYEENNLHGLIIESFNNFEDAIKALETFLPYIDNWATCDLISPKLFKKHLPELYEKIKDWLKSDHIYTVRFALVMLLRHYLNDNFENEMPQLAAAIASNEYYIKMAVAWYFATALAKQPKAIMPYFENNWLEKDIHKKAVQKAIESYRISQETKDYLRAISAK